MLRKHLCRLFQQLRYDSQYLVSKFRNGAHHLLGKLADCIQCTAAQGGTLRLQGGAAEFDQRVHVAALDERRSAAFTDDRQGR